MEGNRRATLTLGVLMLVVGGWFMAMQLVPGLNAWVSQFFDWPWFVIGGGFLFLVAAIVGGVPGLAVPGFIIMGAGGILYYQNATGEWYSWAYMWSLILVAVGLGVMTMHLLEGKPRKAWREGGNTVITGVVFFLIFASFFRPMFGDSPLFGAYWPVAIIAIGLWLLLRAMWPQPKKKVTVIKDDTLSADDAARMMDEADAALDEMDGVLDDVDDELDK
jgi:hypothetical protein